MIVYRWSETKDVRLFDEPMAQLALEALNRRIAAIYCQQPLPTVFVFVDLIDQRRVLQPLGKAIIIHEVLGDCNHAQGIIRLVKRKGWEATAIHELVHRYNPERRHSWVKRAAADIGRLLKQGRLWSNPSPTPASAAR